MAVIDLSKAFCGILLLALLGGLSYLFFWKPAPPAPPAPPTPPASPAPPTPPASPAAKPIFSGLIECAEILDCKTFRGVRNRIQRLESRASPNQRLVRAFGINNAFTTTDGRHARAFRAAAVQKIRLDDSDWNEIATFAQQLVQNSMAMSGPGSFFTGLDKTVQSITMRLALHILFEQNPLDLDQGTISTFTEAINDCWVQSKRSEADTMRKAQVSLNDALTELFPVFDPGSSTQDNPLNYILPAYETLWRIVLLCFIEVSFRQNRQAETVEWRKVLGKFIADPTQAAFEQPMTTKTGQSVSVSHIVNEGLRLYPPTRRIHRLYHLESSLHEPEILAADIEKMQRNPKIWEDPLTFNPSRWLQIGEEARKAFMPFGNKPFVCPAQKDFGPRIIGILVAALAVDFDPEGWELWYSPHCGPERALGNDEEIHTDRDIYESWSVEKKRGGSGLVRSLTLGSTLRFVGLGLNGI